MTLAAPPRTGLAMANLTCALSMVSWAAGLPAADVLIPLVPALPLTAARMVLAALVLVAFWALIEGLSALRAAPWGRAIGIGSLLSLGGLLLLLGQARTDAVTVAVIAAVLPVVGIALEVALDGRRLGLALVLGGLLSLVGGVVALTGQPLGLDLGLGAAFCLGSVVVYALASRWSVTALPDMSPLGRSAATVAGAGLAALVVALAGAAMGAAEPDWASLGLREAWALILFAIFSMSISQLLWVYSVGALGIGMAALHINAAPFYVMLIALAFGGTWSGAQALGAICVAAGVMVAQGHLRLPGRRG